MLETLKVCGVDKPEKFDRNSESYDYSLKYRLNGENSMKRRQSNNSDDSGERNRFEYGGQSKRFRASSMGSGLGGRDGKRIRKNVRLRLGHKSEDSSSNDGLCDFIVILLFYINNITDIVTRVVQLFLYRADVPVNSRNSQYWEFRKFFTVRIQSRMSLYMYTLRLTWKQEIAKNSYFIFQY